MTAPRRGDVVVCIVGTATQSADAEDGLRNHTPADVPILTAASEAEAFAATTPADVILLAPGCVVAGGWLESMRQATNASATTATATALTQHDLDGAPEPFDQAAAAVRARSLHLRPRIDVPGSACVYVRRSAIELIGAEGPDFWARCLARGLTHVLADDVLVLDPGAAPSRRHEPTPPEARATRAARSALHGFSATIDARILAGPTTGTQVHVLELISGLARTEQINLRAIIPEHPSQDALTRLRALPRLELLTYSEAAGIGRTDIVHRPFQLSNAGDLSFLESLGERLILTQQDLIAFHNPAYFPTRAGWQEYRELTRSALAAADRVLFFSAHARDDALSEDLVEEAHAEVVHLGVDHQEMVDSLGAPPADADTLGGRPFLLCIGTDFLHKNRIFALRVLRALIELGADTTLVFAGPTVQYGSSRSHESAYLAAHPALAGHVRDLGAVSEAEKHWLYRHAALVVYPTVLEGFGLVPFEAADHRVPCLWAPGSSLSELLPDHAAGIVPWNSRQSAEQARALIGDQRAREENLSAIDMAAAGLTWDATAANLLAAYQATAAAPARPRTAAAVALSEDAARLVGPGGELPADVHRPLLALATHPSIARPVYRALRLGYRVSHALGKRQRRR